MRLAVLAVLLAAFASSGCLVLSLQPAYDDGSIAFNESLLGAWTDADDQTQATIERGEWRSYKVTYTDRFTTRTFDGNLTAIADAAYLDLTEMRGEDVGPYLIPVHAIYRVALDGDTLSAATLDYNWFTDAIGAKSLGRLNVALDDRRNVILAAATVDLRRWLARAPADAFGAPMTFTRSR